MTSAGLLILASGFFLITLASIPKVHHRIRGLFYGWYVTTACLLIALVTVGARQAFGVFVIPMSNEFNWSRGTISLAGALGILVNGLSQPLLGMSFDRHGRKVILISLVVLDLSTMALSLTFHILFLAFVFGVVAPTALSGASLSNTGALLSRWFRRRRATAVGLSVTGVSFGVLLLVPIAMFLLQFTGSWRIAWLALGLITLLSVPLAFMFLHNDPANDRYPRWSPNGARIAFHSDRVGNFEVYVMDADGSGQTRLTQDPADDGWPSWSPNGARIAFHSDRVSNLEIYVMNADGSGQVRLTSNSAADAWPSWGP